MYFHPWDRLSLLLWLLTMWAIREDRPYLALLPLVFAISTKWDAVVLPALYFMVWARRENLWPVSVRTAVLGAVALSVYTALRLSFPGGHLDRDIVGIIASNLRDILFFNIAHAPLLAFTIPVLLLIAGFTKADRFCRASVIFGALLFIPLMAGAVFREVRAEMMILVAFLPAALTGLQRLAAETSKRTHCIW